MTDIEPLTVGGNRYCQNDGCRRFAFWSVIVTPTHVLMLCNRHADAHRGPDTAQALGSLRSVESELSRLGGVNDAAYNLIDPE